MQRVLDRFAVYAPNAVLITDDLTVQNVTIIESFNPVYHTASNTLKYDISPENATSIDLPGEFGQSALVIDELLGWDWENDTNNQ